MSFIIFRKARVHGLPDPRLLWLEVEAVRAPGQNNEGLTMAHSKSIHGLYTGLQSSEEDAKHFPLEHL